MELDQSKPVIARFLTTQETIEMARIQKNPDVIAYALIGFDGTEIEASGAWSSLIAPVFANAFDLADKMGEEVGESEPCPVLFLESPDFEIAGITLSSARAVVIKRRPRRVREGLRSVG
ncbi:MAG: hypothetical protein AAF334_02855 [Pseudomonadota bacterium]